MGERVVAREAEQHAERSRGDLGIQLAARRVRRRRDVQLFAPEVRCRVDLDHAERDGAVDLRAKALHPLELLLGRDDVLARDPLRGQLEDRPATCGHRPAEPEQFVLGGIGARHRLAVHCPVTDGARRREAERAGLDALLHDACHRRDVLGRGRLVARTALAHRVGADRAVRHLTAHVDREVLLSDHVEVLGVALPAPRNTLGECGARNVLDALHQLISQSSLPGRTGAKPTPQLPATTVVTPWPLDGSSRLSQLT